MTVTRHPSILVANARVLTMDPTMPHAEAIAITGNRVSAVGTSRDLLALKGPGTRVIDAGGGTVTPGFIESHMHVFQGGATLSRLSLEGVRGFDALAAALRRRAAQRPDEAIVFGLQASYQLLPEPLTRHILDRIIGDRPVALYAPDGHTVWANTAALERAGLLRGANLRPGNEVVMGADGLATGELREPEAFEPVFRLLPTGGREALGYTTGRDPSPAPDAAGRAIDKTTIKAGIEFCARHGITTIHNMDGNDYQLDLLNELEDESPLACRFRLPYHQKNDKTLAELTAGAPAMRARSRPDRLFTDFVKIFVDGVLDSTTALMLDDYTGHPGNRGLALFTAEALNEAVTEADRLGFQVAIHSIGDLGVRRSLDAFEAAARANGRRDARHRVEHIEIIDPADIPRFRSLGVIASMQPLHAPGPLSYDGASLMGLLGAGRQPYAFAWQTLRDAGASMCFASDWPVSPVNPLLSIEAAMTRRPWRPEHPEQAQTLHQAIHGYTVGGAFAEFAEDRKGMLRAGYLADVAVLDLDLERLTPDEIKSASVTHTICDGRITHQSG